jgi:hypothetical protein
LHFSLSSVIIFKATIPFASAEILDGEPMFLWNAQALKMTGMQSKNVDTRPHNAIHDLESFFWVLTYLCLTRQGPGGRRRDELMPQQSRLPENEPIVRPFFCFFGDEDIGNMAKNKRKLFQLDDYKEYVLKHTHPYFLPLEPLLLKWWKILRLGYKYPVFEAVHDAFLDALKETIEALKNQPQERDDAAAAVDATRLKDLTSLRYFPDGVGENSKIGVNPLSTTSELSPSRDVGNSKRDYKGSIIPTFIPGEPPESPMSRVAKKSRTQTELGDIGT